MSLADKVSADPPCKKMCGELSPLFIALSLVHQGNGEDGESSKLMVFDSLMLILLSETKKKVYMRKQSAMGMAARPRQKIENKSQN